MSLLDEVKAARKKVVTDGYEMSLGELINLYKDNELKIDPVFQRLFRWDDERKTRFIESLLLGIPFPPIFVFQNEGGIWELIDGLQRLSTLFQLTGDLKGERAQELGPLVLNGTQFLPSLDGKRWADSSDGAEDGIGQSLQIEIKRARVRVEILKSESDLAAKFELFQRLNTGGAGLTEQEVRNSIAVSINPDFYHWLIALSEYEPFRRTTAQTDSAIEAQAGVELVLRFLSFRSVPYRAGLDVHEYLDRALIEMATNRNFDKAGEDAIFVKTFRYLDEALSDQAFKRWNGHAFAGKFLMSVFEVLATGVSHNVAALEAMEADDRSGFIVRVARGIWNNNAFTTSSGAGVRGTTRLSKLLPIAAQLLNPNQ
ncbi:hypothetical protein S58_44530 [Bradyrhizobium oligotrophicum S58]|uniref:GmrSD restriction endonucleases N-terminal domain-containing protein n=1 Tax=Bradyrhizobium oligotrophicum S58 TaxID=1245469 RepID=M4Z9J4_9BRAD|nr:DUF262 domain-containing protein [Bradyrhizobium oligotrophicum]BAM90438.1 hypothetical protein S58_44530 [Bradyrhizobium oligotrophicum S58]